jgi:hypothetical protein
LRNGARALLEQAEGGADIAHQPDGQINTRFFGPSVNPPLRKYFCFSEVQIRLYDLPSRPERGALRNVINAGRDAVDADGAADESA